MEDVLAVYARPYNPQRPQICLDEAAKQLLSEVRAPLPIKPGQQERVDNEYVRQGTCALFMLFEPLAQSRPRDRESAVCWYGSVAPPKTLGKWFSIYATRCTRRRSRSFWFWTT